MLRFCRMIPRCVPFAFICSLAMTHVMGVTDQEAFWPQFHGPNRDNKSIETGLLKKWPEDGPKLLWTAKGLGFGYSSVSIASGMIFTAGDIKNQTVITALDMKGQIVWQEGNGEAWLGSYPGSRGTPTIDGDRLYHENPNGDVICMEAKTGKKIWTVNILEKFEGINLTWALAESLLIDGEHVICCPGGPQTCMVALDKHTGELVWKAESSGDKAGYASPILVDCQGLRIIITLTSRAMIGVNADTGELLWRVEHKPYAEENVLMPIYLDGHVFASGVMAGSVQWKINVNEGKASVEEVWRSEDMDNHHGGVLLVDGYLYGSSCVYHKEQWICLDWRTGEKKYVDKGKGKGSLTYADGLLYTLSRERTVGLVKPTPKGYELVSAFKIPKGGKGPSWAHPVVCVVRLYIRHGEFLYTYDVHEIIGK